MIDVNGKKSSAHVQSTFSIVKNMLADCAHSLRATNDAAEQRFKNLGYVAVPTTDIAHEQQMVQAIAEDQVTAEEFTRMLRGEHNPIVMGLSAPRVLAAADYEETSTEYQKKVAQDQDRVTVGLHYMPMQTWTERDSVITYFGILDALPASEFAKEQECDFYQTMLDKAIQLFIAEDRAFTVLLKRRGYCPNWLAKKPSADAQMAIVLPSGNRVVFDDF